MVAVAYILVFWICGRLWEVVAHEGSTVFGELRQDFFVARIFVVSTPVGVIYTIKAMMKWGGRFEMFLSFLKYPSQVVSDKSPRNLEVLMYRSQVAS